MIGAEGDYAKIHTQAKRRPKLGPGSDRDGSAEEPVAVKEKTPKERWAALLEAIDRDIPADVTAEEITAEAPAPEVPAAGDPCGTLRRAGLPRGAV
jgi:hypothetical protein